MLSLTKNRARACLSTDDLAGLNFLYPTCNDALVRDPRARPPACIKSKRNVGALRFTALVMLPFMACEHGQKWATMAGLLWRARAAHRLLAFGHPYLLCHPYLLWQASFGVLVLLIIYAKRRESARFLRIQNNLQGILGKQALLTMAILTMATLTMAILTMAAWATCRLLIAAYSQDTTPYRQAATPYRPLPPLTPFPHLDSSTHWRAAATPTVTSTKADGGRASPSERATETSSVRTLTSSAPRPWGVIISSRPRVRVGD